jgi:hypothetical protein
MMARAMGHEPRVADGRPHWPRFQVELPPEHAEELMRLYRLTMGPNASSASRAGLLRTAILAWWEQQSPEPDAPIEATATDVLERPALPRAHT